MITRRRNIGGIRPYEFFLLAGILVLASFSILYSKRHFEQTEFRAEIYRQRIELPSSEVLDFLALGYENVYADWLWLQSIQAFGSGWQTDDGTQEPIFDYFDALTDLDPHFISAYRFGNLIIGDQRRDHELGQEILRKGTHLNPMNYDLPYLGIYNALWNADDPDGARWFARRLNRIPDAPAFMKRLEEYIERREGRVEIAYEYNVRYLLDYIAADNDIERDIAMRRIQDLLDRLYRRKIAEAAIAYMEERGEHPRQMEALLNPKYLPPFQGPTMQGLRDALDYYAGEIEQITEASGVPEDLVQRIVERSRETIVGLPPEPYGTWYYILEPSVDYYAKEEGLTLEELKEEWSEEPPYLRTAKDSIEAVNQAALAAQRFILEYHEENDGALPSDQEMARFLGRDPLGGHYVYDRESELSEYGVYYSTAGRRIAEGQEPRLGLRGPGPFPFSIQPRLSDNPVDLRWGIANNYIGPDGSEIWDAPGDEEMGEADAVEGALTEELPEADAVPGAPGITPAVEPVEAQP